MFYVVWFGGRGKLGARSDVYFTGFVNAHSEMEAVSEMLSIDVLVEKIIGVYTDVQSAELACHAYQYSTKTGLLP